VATNGTHSNGNGDGFDLRQLSGAARMFLAAVIAPTLLAVIYYGLIASDRYVAEARYAIRAGDEGPAGGIVDSFLGSTSGSGGAAEDVKVVRDFILSRDMLERLDGKMNLRGHYQSPSIDFLSRLHRDVSFERFTEYYLDKVEIEVDPSSNISTLRVRAFDPETALELASAIIEFSEDLVNRMTDRIVEDTLRFSRDEVKVAEGQVRTASRVLTGFRTDSRTIDPGQETSAVLGIVTQLESTLATARTELIQAESFMNPDSVHVKNLRSRVNAMEQQVLNERRRLAADNGGSAVDYTRIIDSYEPLALEKALAEQRYASALTSLEAARAEAQRKQRYLIAFVNPRLPDEAVEPKRLLSILTVFIAALLLYAIGGLVWAAIKDHLRM
jgi:capsular polysaccharide transport system permease protein